MAGIIFLGNAIFQYYVSWSVYDDEDKSMQYLFTGTLTLLIGIIMTFKGYYH